MNCDYLLITVTDIETDELFAALMQRYGRPPVAVTDKGLTFNDLGMFGSSTVYHIRSQMGSDTPGGSAISTYRALTALFPQRVIMVGIAFGIDEERQAIGTVLVSESIKPYDFKKISTKRCMYWWKRMHYEFRAKEVLCPYNTVSLFKAIRDVRVAQGRLDPAIEVGPILSGQTLIDNLEFRDLLIKHLGNAVGGEMEGAGLYAAVHACPTDWIIVKAICDWADGNKQTNKVDRQHQAARSAANLVYEALDTLA